MRVCGQDYGYIRGRPDGRRPQRVRLPHVIGTELLGVDAYTELFKKPHETVVYGFLSGQPPHAACSMYSAVLKAVEVAAGLALPADVAMRCIEASFCHYFGRFFCGGTSIIVSATSAPKEM
jgi:hypothetical protein